MNYKVKLVLTRIDPEGAAQAEELDREVEDAVRALDVQGYEVNELRTRVEREGEDFDRFEMDRLAQRIVMIKQLADQNHLQKPDVGPKDPMEAIATICNSMLDEWESDRRAQDQAKTAAKPSKKTKKTEKEIIDESENFD